MVAGTSGRSREREREERRQRLTKTIEVIKDASDCVSMFSLTIEHDDFKKFVR